MNIQTIIVAIIVAVALAYIGRTMWRKTRSFSSKNPCGNDCGCDKS